MRAVVAAAEATAEVEVDSTVEADSVAEATWVDSVAEVVDSTVEADSVEAIWVVSADSAMEVM